MIAVGGASGAVGSRVARRLARRAVAIRQLLRDPARAPVEAGPGAELAVVSSYDDQAGMRAALRGCDTFFLVSGREAPNRLEQHRAAIDAAVDSGVDRIDYLSFAGAAPDCVFTFGRDHWHTEQHIRNTSLRFSFLRDCFYLGLLPQLAGPDGVIAGPAGDGRVAAVSQDDVADAAAVVLAEQGEDGTTVELTGPEAISLAEAAAVITAACGQEVRYAPQSVQEAYASRAGLAADFEVAGWVSSYEAIAAGEVSQVTDDVARLTGHPARDLRTELTLRPELCAHLRR